MASALTLNDIDMIVGTNYGDPHRILGMHEVEINNKKALSVRVFIPGAKSIACVDALDGGKTYPLEMIHKEGFFEANIEREEWFLYKLIIEGHYGESWETYDPYSFEPAISDYDTYLFAQGVHYNVYEKLGGHLCKINGVKGAAFGVWAPYAIRVSVIGDFNTWDGRRNVMRNLNNSGVWEIFVPGLRELDKYKFEIKSADGRVFEKSDPYGCYWELRPSTSNLLYDINKYSWQDDDWIKKRNKTDIFKSPINIYEAHLGGFMRAEDEDNSFLSYVEMAEKLIPYVKEMGYTHIELMPVSEYPYDGSWGYQVTGYFAPTSRYGSPREFMYFVDKCHEAGIGLFLDWVPAHFPKDANGLIRFDGTALYEHENPLRGEHPDWGTLIFNYGRNEVKNFLISNALYWVEKFHIDGIRVDAVASMLYLNYGSNRSAYIPNSSGGKEDYEAVEFLKHLNSVLLSRNPNVLMIAEESTAWPGVTRPPESGGLGFSMKWNLGWMNDFLEYMSKDPIYRSSYNNNITFGMMYNYSENFILPLSHDEVVHGKKSLIDKMPGDLWQKCASLRLAYLFMFGHPGKKLLFMGGEYGQFREWTEKESLEWFMLEYEHHAKIKDFVKELNHLYLEQEALWYNDFNIYGFEWINCQRPDISVVSFARKGEKDNSLLIFICNFTPVVRDKFRVGVNKPGRYVEILNSDCGQYGGSGVINPDVIESEAISFDNHKQSVVIDLPPLGGVILKYEVK